MFHHSKFRLKDLRHHTPLAATYVPKNSRMHQGRGDPVVRLGDGNKRHLWIKATKSQVLTGYGPHGIRESQSELTEFQSKHHPVSFKNENGAILLFGFRMKYN